MLDVQLGSAKPELLKRIGRRPRKNEHHVVIQMSPPAGTIVAAMKLKRLVLALSCTIASERSRSSDRQAHQVQGYKARIIYIMLNWIFIDGLPGVRANHDVPVARSCSVHQSLSSSRASSLMAASPAALSVAASCRVTMSRRAAWLHDGAFMLPRPSRLPGQTVTLTFRLTCARQFASDV